MEIVQVVITLYMPYVAGVSYHPIVLGSLSTPLRLNDDYVHSRRWQLGSGKITVFTLSAAKASK